MKNNLNFRPKQNISQNLYSFGKLGSVGVTLIDSYIDRYIDTTYTVYKYPLNLSSLILNQHFDLEQEYPSISIAVNVRQRRNPKVPVTQFGNLSIATLTRVTKNNPDTGLYGIATCIREDIDKIDENYCQTYVDFIAGSNVCQHACFFDRSALRVTNWNKLYDWYGSTSLGRGPPQKMVFLNREIDRMCLVIPSEKVGDIEIHISLPQEQMEKFKEHRNVKSYFVMN